MKKEKRVIWCIVALLAVGLAAWRLWPRSIDSFMKRPIGNDMFNELAEYIQANGESE